MDVRRQGNTIICKLDRYKVSVIVCNNITKSSDENLARSVRMRIGKKLILNVFYARKMMAIFVINDRIKAQNLLKEFAGTNVCAVYNMKDKLTRPKNNPNSSINVSGKDQSITVYSESCEKLLILE